MSARPKLIVGPEIPRQPVHGKWEAKSGPNAPFFVPFLEDKLAEVARELLPLVMAEMESSDSKWGPQFHGRAMWCAILMEEVGEVAKATCDNESQDAFEAELIQVASVALNMLWHCRRRP